MRFTRLEVIVLAVICFCATPFGSQVRADDKIIVLAHETSWAPHYGKDLEQGGYTVEIIRESLKRVGYELEIVWLPWKRAQVEAARGDYDGLGASYYTEERATKFAYSEPIAATQIVFFKRAEDNIRYSKLEDLKPYKIGTGFGYGYPEEFLKADYLQKVEAYELKTNITRLLHKRVDLIIGSREAILFYLKQDYPDKIHSVEIVGKPLETLSLYVPFSKSRPNYKQKLKDFNRGLKMTKEDGTYQKIMKKHGLDSG
ncbi:MAG: transporter substrate-binding domain-containing protein [Deltaproteobacteria bacterium]|nr:transporter substrate-binding domain-containing protein [Deltaproteobacteria bacterium]